MLARYLFSLIIGIGAVGSGDAETTLSVHNAWIREAPPTATALAGYLTIENHGVTPRKLIGAESAEFGSIELHKSIVKNGVASMVPKKSVSIPPAGGKVELRPNGCHLMMLAPTKPLRAGTQVTLTLKFNGDENVTTTMPVRNAGGTAMHHHHHQ
ncbi:MAG: copper chaperone PCu(A)C [Gammaproteobacteria bacterium]|nr:copper chaperone PCu(A)C [Gammaproteobacteria bacterium]MBA3732079.1 copper chaperone PCu(A)C [Gammaproteobacteria bacterium]